MIFDCDGVLVDSEGISNEVLGRLLTAAGLPTSTEESIGNYQGLMLDEVTEQVSGGSGDRCRTGSSTASRPQRELEFRARLQPLPGAEDSGSGVEAALAAGMRTYRYVANGEDVQPQDDAEAFRSMYDLPALIGLAPER